MSFLEAIRLAFQSINSQRLKSFFSLLGVLIGVTFLIAVVSIVEGMNVFMEQKFATAFVGVNTLQVKRRPNESWTQTPEQKREWNRRPPLREAEARSLEAGVAVSARFSRVCSGSLTISWRGRLARGVDVVGADETYFPMKKYEIAAGRPFGPPEVRVGMPVVVLGALVASKLLEGVDPIGQEVGIGGLPYRVVGVLAAQGELFGQPLDKLAVIPYGSPARRWLCEGKNLDWLSIQVPDGSQLTLAASEVEGVLRRVRGLKPNEPSNFTIETSEGALDTWSKISAVLIVALPGLVAISLVVGGIVIMNIMLMAVSERTREIGIRKALGARRRDILAQFLIEAATLSVTGALLGIGLGIGLAFLLRSLTPLPASVAPWSVGVGVTLGIVVGVVAGFYPASRASLLDPITALRAE
ncbi:MAG: ABC transporter permease [Gemmatimonadota bacterium]